MTVAEFKRRKKEELALQKAKPLQKISNNFIDNTIVNSNANAIKTIYYLASILEKMEQLKEVVENDNALLSVEINTREMLKYTNMTLPEIRRNFKAMQETSITFINEKENIEEGLNLLPKYKFVYGKHKIEILIFPRIANMIIDVKRNYTFLNTKELMRLKSKHSLRLLPLLQKIANYDEHVGKRKRMELAELNEFFGTKYKTYYEIERKILIPVKEELDNNSKLTFIYEFNYQSLGRGRPRIKEVVIDVITRNSYQAKLI
jgi:plasmid replication initiation protein